MTDFLSETIPVVVMTGFLGAGKTTLLNAVLADPRLRDTAVVINEFGDIAVDHDFVQTGSRDLVITTTGCLCCTASSDIRASLFDLLEACRADNVPPFSRIVVETTGLADPAQLVNALTPGALPLLGLGDDEVARRFRLAAILTCFDAVTGESALQQAFEAVKQVAFASAIVVTKSDLAEDAANPCHIAELTTRLSGMNPSAEILDRDGAIACFPRFFEGAYIPSDRIDDVAGWLALDRMLRSEEESAAPSTRSVHAGDISAMSLIHDGPVTRSALNIFLMLLSNTAGASLLRMKGLVCLAEEPDRPVIVHAVQHLMHPLTQLTTWPNEDRRTRLVVIGRGHDERAIVDIFKLLAGESDHPAARRNWRGLAGAAGVVLAMAMAMAMVAGFFHFNGSGAVADVHRLVIPANGVQR